MMEDVDLAQPAIVFWMHHPGEITRFERLGDAIMSIMHAPLAKTTSIAWIRTKDCNIAMDEIRLIARRLSLSWRLSQVAKAVTDTTDNIKSLERPKRRRRRWSAPFVPQS
jgi:hypothetical protein